MGAGEGQTTDHWLGWLPPEPGDMTRFDGTKLCQEAAHRAWAAYEATRTRAAREGGPWSQDTVPPALARWCMGHTGHVGHVGHCVATRCWGARALGGVQVPHGPWGVTWE